MEILRWSASKCRHCPRMTASPSSAWRARMLRRGDFQQGDEIIRQPDPRSGGAGDSPPRQSVSRLPRRQARHGGQFHRAGQFRALALASRSSARAGSQVLRPLGRRRCMTTDAQGVAQIPQSGRNLATLGWLPLTPFRQVHETCSNVDEALILSLSAPGAFRHDVGSVEHQMRVLDRAPCAGHPVRVVVRSFPPDRLCCDVGS
jgi:hypothetical protein